MSWRSSARETESSNLRFGWAGWPVLRGMFVIAAGFVLLTLMLAGCGASAEDGGRDFQGPADEAPAINPTPEKENGEPSYEFEPSDIERAEEAEQSVRNAAKAQSLKHKKSAA
jgi:hypothetical protein